MKPRLWIGVIVLLLAPFAMAQGEVKAPLRVGDPAPPLSARRWVKGEPIREFERGKIYVITMWATWCDPFLAAVPVLSRIQADYEKDNVIVIAQDIWEDNPPEVSRFVRQKVNEIGFRVAMDDLSSGAPGKMAETWMKASGQKSLPCAFVVNGEGKLAWIGYPTAVEPVLKQMIAGEFDLQKSAADLAELERIHLELQKAMLSRKWDRVLSLLDDYQADQPAAALRDRAGVVRFFVLLQKGDYEAAWEQGRTLLEKYNDDAIALNELSWTILVEPGLTTRDLDLAEKMAVRSVELSKRQNAEILDTLARVHFERGRIDEAIALQTEALDRSDESLKRVFEATLNRYRQAKSSGK